jgi:hypothetical protein
MSIGDKLTEIYNIIQEIDKEDPGTATILFEGFSLAINTIDAVVAKGNRDEVDISEQINIMSNALGFSLKAIVEEILKGMAAENVVENPTKEADPATLEFITSGLDDYEKFLAENKAKENLSFLSKEI